MCNVILIVKDQIQVLFMMVGFLHLLEMSVTAWMTCVHANMLKTNITWISVSRVAKALKPFTQPTAFQIAVGCAKSIKKNNAFCG